MPCDRQYNGMDCPVCGPTFYKRRAGSEVAVWAPEGGRPGVIEVHPDHLPRIHYFDGTSEEIKPAEGPVMVELPKQSFVRSE